MANSARFSQQTKRRSSNREIVSSRDIFWTTGTWQRWQTYRHRIVTFRDDQQKHTQIKREREAKSLSSRRVTQKERFSRSCRAKSHDIRDNVLKLINLRGKQARRSYDVSVETTLAVCRLPICKLPRLASRRRTVPFRIDLNIRDRGNFQCPQQRDT